MLDLGGEVSLGERELFGGVNKGMGLPRDVLRDGCQVLKVGRKISDGRRQSSQVSGGGRGIGGCSQNSGLNCGLHVVSLVALPLVQVGLKLVKASGHA